MASFIDIFQIMSKSNVLLQNTLSMTSSQRTFSVALSRDMVPEAKIVVHALTGSGEILADSLQFHVRGMESDKVRIGL